MDISFGMALSFSRAIAMRLKNVRHEGEVAVQILGFGQDQVSGCQVFRGVNSL